MSWWFTKLEDIPVEPPGWCRNFECQRIIPDVKWVPGEGWARNEIGRFCSYSCYQEARGVGGYLWLQRYSPATLALLGEAGEPI